MGADVKADVMMNPPLAIHIIISLIRYYSSIRILILSRKNASTPHQTLLQLDKHTHVDNYVNLLL